MILARVIPTSFGFKILDLCNGVNREYYSSSHIEDMTIQSINDYNPDYILISSYLLNN